MNDQMLLGWIQQCVAEDKYYVEPHATAYHPLAEGFRVSHVLVAIARGTIVSHRVDDCVCVVCGDVPGLRVVDGYHGNYLHAVINYDRLSEIIIITMYRPKTIEWRTAFERR